MTGWSLNAHGLTAVHSCPATRNRTFIQEQGAWGAMDCLVCGESSRAGRYLTPGGWEARVV